MNISDKRKIVQAIEEEIEKWEFMLENTTMTPRETDILEGKIYGLRHAAAIVIGVD